VIPTPLLSGPPVAGWQLADSRAPGEIVEEMLISAQLAADPGPGELHDPGELVADTVTSMYVLAADAGSPCTQSHTAPGWCLVPGRRYAAR
jgi:hypothetical protein